MKTIKEKQKDYYIKPIDAIITEHTMIPGINGRKVNINKSYQKMKGINEFRESLLVFDEIKPNINIDNIYDKIIISGNQNINQIVLLTNLGDNYCYTYDLTINNECLKNKKHTLLIHKINNNYYTKIKEIITNGIIIFFESYNQNDLNIIIKYLKNNHYEIISIDRLIQK